MRLPADACAPAVVVSKAKTVNNSHQQTPSAARPGQALRQKQHLRHFHSNFDIASLSPTCAEPAASEIASNNDSKRTWVAGGSAAADAAAGREEREAGTGVIWRHAVGTAGAWWQATRRSLAHPRRSHAAEGTVARPQPDRAVLIVHLSAPVTGHCRFTIRSY